MPKPMPLDDHTRFISEAGGGMANCHIEKAYRLSVRYWK